MGLSVVISSSLLRGQSRASTGHVGHRRCIAMATAATAATATAVAAITTSEHVVTSLGECFDLALSILQHHAIVIVNRGMRIDARGSPHGPDANGAARDVLGG